MVFSDPIFLAGFLPASLLIYYLIRTSAGGTAAVCGLVGLSMIFYSYWSVPFLCLLLFQIGVNYTVGHRLETAPHRALLPLAIVFNLCLLGYFKYRNFFLENVGELLGVQFYLTALVVPLGISFHTFQQIAMLVDLKNKQEKLPPLLNYVLFVLFFPQLIAGPIVLHREMGKQVAAVRRGTLSGFEMFAPGVQAHYILHQMFMPSEPVLSAPAWLASALPFELPIRTFTLFDELRHTAYCLFWIALLAFLAGTLPAPAAAAETLLPSPRTAYATAAMILLIAALIGEPRTFLYFTF